MKIIRKSALYFELFTPFLFLLILQARNPQTISQGYLLAASIIILLYLIPAQLLHGAIVYSRENISVGLFLFLPTMIFCSIRNILVVYFSYDDLIESGINALAAFGFMQGIISSVSLYIIFVLICNRDGF